MYSLTVGPSHGGYSFEQIKVDKSGCPISVGGFDSRGGSWGTWGSGSSRGPEYKPVSEYYPASQTAPTATTAPTLATVPAPVTVPVPDPGFIKRFCEALSTLNPSGKQSAWDEWDKTIRDLELYSTRDKPRSAARSLGPKADQMMGARWIENLDDLERSFRYVQMSTRELREIAEQHPDRRIATEAETLYQNNIRPPRTGTCACLDIYFPWTVNLVYRMAVTANQTLGETLTEIEEKTGVHLTKKELTARYVLYRKRITRFLYDAE